MTFEEWFEQDLVDGFLRDDMENCWRAAQEDMRERAAIALDNHNALVKFDGDSIRALPIEV